MRLRAIAGVAPEPAIDTSPASDSVPGRGGSGTAGGRRITFSIEARTRDALLDAMIPAPGDGLPAMAELDRRDFWRRFAHAAPWTLRFGFRAATWLVGGVAPIVLGHRTTFARLDDDTRDDVLRRTERLPGGAALLLLVKLVACFAYFDDPRVQRIARSGDDASVSHAP